MSADNSAGIFLVSDDNHILIGHPTGSDGYCWTIPKGRIEKGETIIEAAVRETLEETSFSIPDEFISYSLKRVKYRNRRKYLNAIVILERDNTHIGRFKKKSLKCNSFHGHGIPEIDDFMWATIKQARRMLHYTQVGCLDEIEKLIGESDE
jgi:8-oxo-dGTP diphosphatase